MTVIWRRMGILATFVVTMGSVLASPVLASAPVAAIASRRRSRPSRSRLRRAIPRA